MIRGGVAGKGLGEHSTVTLEAYTASRVERVIGGEKADVTGGRLEWARAIVEGMLMTLTNFAFVMWIA